jgi:glutathione S-transferase
MKLYSYVASANAWKCEVALAQLGLRFERIEVPIFTADVDGVRRVPVLELDDGTRLPESNAILWHLARGTQLLPERAFGQSQVLAWLFFEQNEVEPVLGSARFWTLTGRSRGREDDLARRVAGARAALGKLEAHLRGHDCHDWLVDGAYSIADLSVYAYVHLAGDVGLELPPAVRAWCARVEQQPGWFAGPAPYTPDAMV